MTLITAAQLAAQLGVDRTTVVRRIDAGHLVPVTKLPGKTGAYLFESTQVGVSDES